MGRLKQRWAREDPREQNQNSGLLPFTPGLPGHPPGLSKLPQFYSTQWTELPTRSQAP